MRKIIAVIISIIMFLSFSTVIGASVVYMEDTDRVVKDDNYSLGDVDDNDKVNAVDAYLIKSYITGVNNDINTYAADFDANGKVNARDNLVLKACLAGNANISDYESTSQVGNFTIAGNSISDYEVVLDSDFVKRADDATACDAVLRTYIYEATGVNVPDVIGEENRTKPHMIRIVRMDPLASEEDRMSLGIEDYIYEVKNGDLYIYGTLRGNMYAAYEICEEYLGFRFYTSYETFEYEMRTSDIPEGTNIKHVTRLEFRYSGQGDQSGSRDRFRYYYASRLNGTQVWSGGGSDVGYLTGPLFDNAHSFHSCYQMGRAYYTMLDEGYTDEQIRSDLWKCWSEGSQFYRGFEWQPCASTYGEGSEYYYMIKGMFLLQELKAYEDADYRIELGVNKVSFSHCDNTNGCQCKVCRAKYTGGTLYYRSESAAKAVVDGYGGNYTYNYDPSATAAKRYSITFEAENFTGAYLDMINRAAATFQKVYPKAEVWTIIYDRKIPSSVRPGSNVSIMYCGHDCMQHRLGTGDCGTGTTVLGGNNAVDEIGMKWWADTVHAEGGHIWYWSYAVSYNYSFAPCPDVMDIYYNYDYIINTCGFDGVYYEGDSSTWYNFEVLKSYLNNQFLWNPDMTYDEFVDTIKEFMYMYYGDGYEYIYEYLQMQQEAGDATGYCFVTNHDRPWDYYSWEYLAENYDKMRSLLENAYAMADSSDRQLRIQMLIYSCDFMGISSSWDKLYLNGTAETKKLCEDRLTSLWNYFNDTGLPICGIYELPDELTFDQCPMNLFYSMGAWRYVNIPEFAK